MEYIIVGDTSDYKECLIFVCGKSLEFAQQRLDQMINNPSESDKRLFKDHENLKIKEVADENCWWNRL